VKHFAIIGGGAWGTALATAVRRAGGQVRLWARDPAIVAAINERHENQVYLPSVSLDPAITATTAPIEALADAEAVLLAVPAQFLRAVLADFARHLPAETPLTVCAKGIELRSLLTMTELLAELLPENPVAVLSGPSFAAEVARGLPTAIVIASEEARLAEMFAVALGSLRFRPYTSTDPIGVETGGAVKNVLAIACGIVEGRRLGDNARAALITRGLAEMVRLGVAKGASAETFRGLSGLGDLVLTCSATQSRNYALGLALGRGEVLADYLAERRSVAEGVATAAAVCELAARLCVEMPITEAVDAVLHRGMAIDAMVEQLLSRPYRAE
jgi:glycerol-3-phosphate dehydrogenase (NAD(P)+)